MNHHDFNIAGESITALGSGALWWRGGHVLVVSDLHLGKSGRITRRAGPMLPPYETRETLARLDADLQRTDPGRVICLGDSFDDARAADELDQDEQSRIMRMQAGREWIWIEGNHDPGPLGLGGSHRRELRIGPLVFRHIAQADATGEISGHYHPKFTLRIHGQSITRPCFLHDRSRVILPAYGTYTGGLSCRDPALRGLFPGRATAIMTGKTARAFPVA